MLAAGVFATVAAPAHAGPPARVVAVPGLGADELDRLAGIGAVGLVVPDAGPTTSQARALASLERGEVVNSLRGRFPSRPPLVDADVRGRASASDGAVLVGVPRGGKQPNDRRYAIALVGAERGLLTSAATRIPGLVSIADVAQGRLRVQAASDPAKRLRELDRRIRDNGRSRVIGAILASILIAALALLRPRAALLAFATLALGNLALGLAGVSEPSLVIPLLAASALAAIPLATRMARETVFLGGVLAAVFLAYLAAMAADATWVALSPLGPSQNGRFYGISNLLETLLLVPALGGAALLARRFGPSALVAVAVLSLVTVAGSRFGADGGGAIVLAAGFAVLGVGLAGGGRRAAVLGMAAAGLAVAVIAADAVFGPATHVGESLRGGPDEVAGDLWERVELSWRRATDGPATALLVGASLVALVVLVARGARLALPLAVAAAIAVSLVVNDSPREVSAGGVVAYLAAERFARRGHEGSRGYTSGTPKEESKEP